MLIRPIRLDRNEVPFLPPPSVIAAAERGLPHLNRYAGEQELARLRELLGEYAGVPEHQIIVGPGSASLLREIIHAFAGEMRAVTLNPSFSPAVEAARERAPEWESLGLSPPTFTLPPRLLLAETSGRCLAMIDSPNNPTGQITLSRETVRAVLKNPDVLLVIDEAYHEFAQMSIRGKRSGAGPFVDLVAECPNLAVARTLDNAFALAGAGVGYLVAGETFCGAFRTFCPLLPQASLYAALEALERPGYAWCNVERLIVERERVREALETMGADVYPGTANFLLMRCELADAAVRLRDRGVLVSDVSSQMPLGYIRVSIGTPEQNDAFLDTLREIRAEP